ncbi:MAG: glycoside hydrolase family 3 N-terminal domain-containing protein, partial [Oceanicaulis sp.]
HPFLYNRCYGRDVDEVAARARANAEGCIAGGVLPVVKHMPGHGRAGADSHLELPVVDTDEETLSQTDFAAFRAVKGALIGMTAHVTYSAIDPDDCATLSSEVIGRVIRRDIGFDGLLMTDDLSMKALGGQFRTRAERALGAGCDLLLHCNGVMAEMVEIAHAAPRLDHDAKRRADAALAARAAPAEFDAEGGLKRLHKLFEEAGLELK